MNTQLLKDKIANAIKDNLKIEDKEFVNPWQVDKSVLLQETRAFHAAPVDVDKCCRLITKIIYLTSQGQKFTSSETTDLFFAVSKLFQSTNNRLRRMVYLMIKNIEASESEQFIVTSCLTKDMNSKNDSYRGNGIRVLARILDPAMVAQMDRYLKTAVVDKNPFVASSALVCGLNLFPTCSDTIKRWVSEVQNTVLSKYPMVQYHSLALLYEIKRGDRLALHKVFASLTKGQLKSNLAECLMIRICTNTLIHERDPSVEKALLTYIDGCLRHKNEMVTYEAAKAFCRLAAELQSESDTGSTVLGHDFVHAITLLQIYLTSPKPVVRFAAIRTLNKLAHHRPSLVARCNCDMDPLLSDQNRTIATLALTTLLKTGHESNVDRLVKQITSFMSDITDVFKIEVVRAVKGLCLQYPGKHKVLMGFLSSNLREEGSAEFKKDLVEALILMTTTVPNAKETGLLHLCEFIEDCEYPALSTKILGILGDAVPTTSAPAKYIRFIYNRLILENALVRGAAVNALTKIAAHCPSLKKDVMVLLECGMNDSDDEVRDRIHMYHEMMKLEDYVDLVSTTVPFSIDALYDSLDYHLNNNPDGVFNLANVPSEEAYASIQASKQDAAPTPTVKQVHKSEPEKTGVSAEVMATLTQIVPEDQLGPLQHSCHRVMLTEPEAEYTVACVKHMFPRYVALEFYVTNTVKDVELENVEMKLQAKTPGSFEEVGSTVISNLAFEQSGSCFVVLSKTGGITALGRFGATVTFMLKEDGDDIGFEDQYPIEAFQISAGDYCFPRMLPHGQFAAAYDALKTQGVESIEKFSLQFKTLQQAVDGIKKLLNLVACDRTDQLDEQRTASLLLSGTFIGGSQVLAKALVGIDPNRGCMLKLAVCSRHQAVVDTMLRALQ